MNAFEMVIVIVFVGCVTGVINDYIKQKSSGRSADMDDLLDRLDAVDELEERVRVLETVITGQNYELRKQFQDLEKE